MNTSSGRARITFLFLRYLGARFVADNCTRTAAALSYTTLLSLVPLLAVVFSILAFFPLFASLVDDIQGYIFSHFVPASNEPLQLHFQQFIETAASSGGVGLMFLMLTSLMLMHTINIALNDIWHVKPKRNLFSALLIYGGVLLLSSILFAASILLTSYVVSLPLMADGGEVLAGVKHSLLLIVPIVVTVVALLLFYVVVPNCKVSWRVGMVSALLAALLFELAKKGFAWYVLAFPSYTVIYGALAVIPVFLVWIYVSWLVVLLGAEFSRCLTTFEQDHRDGKVT
ncbi:MAG: YihY family inner membrane protein [Thiotrichaceae bacterium]|nr:YihY family inner membrane protein [Thiotrichaceae bacterium]